MQSVPAACLSLILLAASPAPAPGPADEIAQALGRLDFLAGDWRLINATGQARYRWHPGTLWLSYEVAMTHPGSGSYEVAGGVSFDPQAREYVAYAVNNIAPRLIEYRGQWKDEATLVFDGVSNGSGRTQRVQYVRAHDGTVVFSASESADGAAHRTYFEAVLERLARPVAGRDGPPGGPEADALLDTLASGVQAADYRGKRAELRRLASALEQVTDPRLAADRFYWQGFARWRRALNGFNETPTPADLKNDLEAAVRSFRSALAERPGWIEAKIGIVGCSANLLFLSGDNQAATQQLLTEYVPIMREVVAQGAANPRALWLIGGTELGAPPPYGGDAAKAVATFQRGLDATRREVPGSARPPARVPSWGGAENLMSLAYLHSHSALEDRDLALAYARAALALVPHWHYVSEVLMPQIEALPSRTPSHDKRVASVALRVHRLQAMVAFYSEALGVQFREVEARGIRSWFGTAGGVELKFVPIREGTEFERYPLHQLGFEVPDVRVVVAAAEKHGGRVQDAPASSGRRVRASVRDPDGNTIEIDGPQ